jgi:hypothetical protein
MPKLKIEDLNSNSGVQMMKFNERNKDENWYEIFYN